MKRFIVNVVQCLQIILCRSLLCSDHYSHQKSSRRYYHKKTTLLRMNCPYITVSIEELGKNNKGISALCSSLGCKDA
jgi:hypothetical protein